MQAHLHILHFVWFLNALHYMLKKSSYFRLYINFGIASLHNAVDIKLVIIYKMSVFQGFYLLLSCFCCIVMER